MVNAGRSKLALSPPDLLIRGRLAGAILAAATSLAFTGTVQTNQPLVGALIFPVGLILIVLLGLELVTGSFGLVPLPWLDSDAGAKAMLANWGWVFLGNLIGSVVYGGLLAIALTNFGTTAPAGVAAKIVAIAEAKTIGYEALGFAGMITVFVKAMLCNWMVCLAIVAAMTTTSTIGKIACAYMPIFIFFAQGFEHSVVNMFIIPTGMMMGAKVTVAQWWLWNQIPVTLGNLVGGFVFTGLALYMTHKPRSCRACAARRADAGARRMSEADLKPAATDQSRRLQPRTEALSGRVRRRRADRQGGKERRRRAAAAGTAAAAAPEPTGPDAAGLKAQDRVLAAGGKLSDPEKFKREQHPFDTYERLKEHAAKGEYPKPPDNFRWRFFGLFYVAPNQNSYMCRLRIPNGIVKAAQFAGLADLAERYGGGYAHVTTRANHADPRDRSAQRRRHDRGDPGSRAVLARLRRRQYPQRHRHADRRHRSAGTDRHAPLCARMALSHSQRPLALRPAAQVQCRLRRRRHDSGPGRYQRHRLPGGASERRLRPCARHLVQALPRRHHRPSRFCPRHRRRGAAEGRLQGRRRGRARVHRSRQPHRPHQGAAEICARRHGLREISRPGRGEARPQARPRRSRRAGAASVVRPHRAYRRSCRRSSRA